jgi:hypothetical protein
VNNHCNAKAAARRATVNVRNAASDDLMEKPAFY